MKTEGTEDEIAATTKITSDLEPLVNYYESCIERIVKKGFFLLGKQGGVIYTHQGGNVLTFPTSTLGSLYLEDAEGNNILYFVDKPGVSGTFSMCVPTLPYYPVNITSFNGRPYPYKLWDGPIPKLSSGKEYKQFGCFGTPYPLDTGVMMKGLKPYVEEHIKTDCDFAAFRKYRVNKTDELNVTIKSSLSKTDIFVSSPMIITNLNSGTRTAIKNFKTSINLGFEGLRIFINMIIRSDVDDPTYPIWKSLIGYDFDITIENDVYNYDDVITITSQDLLLDGLPFEFRFGRKNRYPVLDYIYNTSFHNVTLVKDYVVNWSDVIHQELIAVDPDEDNVSIDVLFGGGSFFVPLKNDTPYTISHGDTLIGQIPVRIIASDGQYSDYQEFMIS